MSFADKKGITVTSGFKLQADSLLDVRGCVENIAERDELVTINAATAGLRVFVKDQNKSYVYNGSSWDELTIGAGYTHPLTHPATMITEDENHRFVTDTEKATWNAKADTTLAGASNNGLMSSAHYNKLESLDDDLAGKVDDTTIVNGQPLSGNVQLDADDVGAIPSTLKGANNGVAELDATGKVPESQLPSYVDDVIEGYLNGGKFYEEEAHTTAITAESGKIYVDLTGGANKTYRLSGTTYVEISPSIALGETASTAYRGDRGKIAYEHSQAKHARVDATKTEASATNGYVKIDGTDTKEYEHPANHQATMITEDAYHRFVTDEEKEVWNNAFVSKFYGESDTLPTKMPVGAVIFVAEDNPGWTDEGNNVISTRLLENTLLQPGESAEVEVVLTWINGEDNMGQMTNIAEISEDYNDKGAPDRDSTPDNQVWGEDDIDDAPVLLSIETGQERIYYVLGFTVLGTLAGGLVLIKKFVI